MKGPKGYQGDPPPQVQFAFIGMCTKCCLTVINIFLGLLGACIILVGAYGLYLSTVADDRLRVELEFMYLLATNVAGAMVPLGTALVVVGVAGCIGACQENFPLLKLYMWMLGVFLIIEICMVVGSFLLVWKTREVMTSSLPGFLIEDYRPSTRNILDSVQAEFGCCGLSGHGYMDYDRNPLYNCYESNQSVQKCSVPGSCCLPHSVRRVSSPVLTVGNNDSYSCAQGVLAVDKYAAGGIVYTDGCIGTLTSMFRTLLYGAVSIVVLCALIKMFALYQVRTLLNQIQMLPYNVY